MLAHRIDLVSEEELLSLPETVDKVELLDGEVILAPAPALSHQRVVLEIAVALRAWALQQSAPWTVGIAPQDFRFARSRILQPEVWVLRGRIPLDHLGPIDQVPDLCVEVTSLDRAYDRVTKRFVYAAGGVKEYWVTSPRGPVERFFGEGLAEREEVTGRLVSAVLPGFELDLDAVFSAD